MSETPASIYKFLKQNIYRNTLEFLRTWLAILRCFGKQKKRLSFEKFMRISPEFFRNICPEIPWKFLGLHHQFYRIFKFCFSIMLWPKTTITFWLKKLVILLKTWRVNIENAENISRFSWGTLEKILEIVPRKFPYIGSEELFSGNSQEFPHIWSTFSPVILQNW